MYQASLSFPSSLEPQHPPTTHSVIPRILKHSTKPGVVLLESVNFFLEEKGWQSSFLLSSLLSCKHSVEGEEKMPREIFRLPINLIGHYVGILVITLFYIASFIFQCQSLESRYRQETKQGSQLRRN